VGEVTTRPCRQDLHHFLDGGCPLPGAALLCLPLEASLALVHELIVQGARVVVIDEEQGIPHGQGIEGIEDLRMPLPGRGVPNIEGDSLAGGLFLGHCCLLSALPPQGGANATKVKGSRRQTGWAITKVTG